MFVPPRNRVAVTPRVPFEKSYSARIVSRSERRRFPRFDLLGFFFILAPLGAADDSCTDETRAVCLVLHRILPVVARARKGRGARNALRRNLPSNHVPMVTVILPFESIERWQNAPFQASRPPV